MQQLTLLKNGFAVLLCTLLTAPSVLSNNLTPVKLSGFTTKQGLSQNNVNAIIYDKNGFLWIGTDDGLNVFDGNSFRTFVASDMIDYGLNFNTIRCLAVDPEDNNLWIGTNGALERMNLKDKRVQRVVLENKEEVEDVKGITWSSENEQWVGVNNLGVFYSDDQETYYKIPNSKVSINALVSFQEYILVGHDNGLFIYSAKTHDKLFIPNFKFFSEKSIFSLKVTKNQLYIGTTLGDLFKVDQDLKIKKLYSGSNKIKSITEDNNGNIWLGTEGNGIIRLKKEEDYKPYTLLHHKCTNRTINHLYYGANHNIWIGTFGNGLQLYNENDPFFTLSEDKTYGKGLSHNSVTSFEQLNQNEILIGTDGGGVDKLNIQNGNIENVVPKQYVISLKKIDDLILVGTYQSGLRILDKKNILSPLDAIDQYHNDLSTDNVWDIEEDYFGNIWLATTNGVVKLNLKKKSFVRYKNNPDDSHSISNNDTRKIYRDIKGDIWIGTFNGLNRYDKESDTFKQIHFKSKKNQNININNAIISIAEDDKLNLWIGTFGSGLWKLDRQTDSLYASGINNRLPNKVIYSIENDSHGALWLSTNQGITSYNPKDESIRKFTEEDGLQGKQFNVGASLMLKNNFLIFGGTEGLNIFNPTKTITFLQNIPEVKVNSITVVRNQLTNKDVDISQLNQVSLSPEQRTFYINYFGLEYNYQHNIEYEYRLRNFESNWNQSLSNSSMLYSNLPNGTYFFEIRCRYKNQKWGNTLSFPIILKAYYWETPLFKFAIILTLILIGLGIYFLYVRNLKHQKVALNKIVKERTQELLNKEIDIIEVENQKAQLIKETLKLREKELTTHVLRLAHMNTLVDQIDKKLEDLQQSNDPISKNKISSIRREIKQAENIENDWKTLNTLFSEVHQNFAQKLKENHPDLTEGNLRLCNLIKLNMSSKDIAAILGISLNSVKVARKRLRKRLGLEIDDSLEEYLKNI
ncbi:two-component regulator propeller domain-containing protein [Flammeovirga sp. SJP92]|uniref:ligand-binding sensor domain-containing protein n=1 Tax=Flammeovirga sp. SJP92 TaxID=1775430 RepID=UPI0007897CB2|nr:two-component regulator propeller domain-containing protein [Flammeovirga sp. SJP92]KXX67285.1 hypothetical protein AVL50_28265 [Flammeovirga sp. SJP92]